MAYEIGATEVGMADLADLTTPVTYPKGEYQPFARYARLGDGSIRGFGLPMARWTFPIITVEERDQLKTFCAGASAAVFISTKLNDNSYDDFTATMIWPDSESRFPGGHFTNLVIEFRDLVAL